MAELPKAKDSCARASVHPSDFYSVWSGRVFVKGCYACTAHITSENPLEELGQLKRQLDIQWKLTPKQAEARYFQDGPNLSSSTETLNNGWYCNVCQLKPLQNVVNFDKLSKYLQNKEAVSIIDMTENIFLLMSDNVLTQNFHFDCKKSNTKQPSLFCLLLSRQSRRRTADTDNIFGIMNALVTSTPRPSKHVQDRGVAKRVRPHVQDTYAFQTQPPKSSLIRKSAAGKAFRNQFEASCNAVDGLINGTEPEDPLSGVFRLPEKPKKHRTETRKIEQSLEDISTSLPREKKRHKSDVTQTKKKNLDKSDLEQPSSRKRHKTTCDTTEDVSQANEAVQDVIANGTTVTAKTVFKKPSNMLSPDKSKWLKFGFSETSTPKQHSDHQRSGTATPEDWWIKFSSDSDQHSNTESKDAPKLSDIIDRMAEKHSSLYVGSGSAKKKKSKHDKGRKTEAHKKTAEVNKETDNDNKPCKKLNKEKFDQERAKVSNSDSLASKKSNNEKVHNERKQTVDSDKIANEKLHSKMSSKSKTSVNVQLAKEPAYNEKMTSKKPNNEKGLDEQTKESNPDKMTSKRSNSEKQHHERAKVTESKNKMMKVTKETDRDKTTSSKFHKDKPLPEKALETKQNKVQQEKMQTEKISKKSVTEKPALISKKVSKHAKSNIQDTNRLEAQKDVFSSLFTTGLNKGTVKQLGRIPKKASANTSPVVIVKDSNEHQDLVHERGAADDSEDPFTKKLSLDASNSIKPDKIGSRRTVQAVDDQTEDKTSSNSASTSKKKKKENTDNDKVTKVITDKGANTNTARGRHASSQGDEDGNSVVMSERGENLDIIESLGANSMVDRHSMMKQVLDGAEHSLNSLDSEASRVFSAVLIEKQTRIIPGLGDIDTLQAIDAKLTKRQVITRADMGMKVMFPCVWGTQKKFACDDLQKALHVALFGIGSEIPMSLECRQLHNLVLAIHTKSAEALTRKIDYDKCKLFVTISGFPLGTAGKVVYTYHTAKEDSNKHSELLTRVSHSAPSKTSSKSVNDEDGVSQKLLSIVKREQSDTWMFDSSTKKGDSDKEGNRSTLVIPIQEFNNTSSSDENNNSFMEASVRHADTDKEGSHDISPGSDCSVQGKIARRLEVAERLRAISNELEASKAKGKKDSKEQVKDIEKNKAKEITIIKKESSEQENVNERVQVQIKTEPGTEDRSTRKEPNVVDTKTKDVTTDCDHIEQEVIPETARTITQASLPESAASEQDSSKDRNIIVTQTIVKIEAVQNGGNESDLLNKSVKVPEDNTTKTETNLKDLLDYRTRVPMTSSVAEVIKEVTESKKDRSTVAEGLKKEQIKTEVRSRHSSSSDRVIQLSLEEEKASTKDHVRQLSAEAGHVRHFSTESDRVRQLSTERDRVRQLSTEPDRGRSRSKSGDADRREVNIKAEDKATVKGDTKNIEERLEKLAASTCLDVDKTSRSEKRRERQFHPYKKESKSSTTKSRKPSWSFDLAYDDMNELLQNLTVDMYTKLQKKPAVYREPARVASYSRRSYGRVGKFSDFRFKRSAIPKTPPREVHYSSEEEATEDNVTIDPDVIPDLEERRKRADMLEDLFLTGGTEEPEYKNEMSIYKEEQPEAVSMSVNKVTATEGTTVSVKPEASTSYNRESPGISKLIEENEKEKSYEVKASSKKSPDKEKAKEVGDKDSEGKNLNTLGRISFSRGNSRQSSPKSSRNSSPSAGSDTRRVQIKDTRKPTEKQVTKTTHVSVIIDSDSDSELDGALAQPKAETDGRSLTCSKETGKAKPVTEGRTLSDAKEIDKAKAGAVNTTEIDNSDMMVLSPESICLDWTDEEITLDAEAHHSESNEETGGNKLSMPGHLKNFIVLDMVEESDSDAGSNIASSGLPRKLIMNEESGSGTITKDVTESSEGSTITTKNSKLASTNEILVKNAACSKDVNTSKGYANDPRGNIEEASSMDERIEGEVVDPNTSQTEFEVSIGTALSEMCDKTSKEYDGGTTEESENEMTLIVTSCIATAGHLRTESEIGEEETVTRRIVINKSMTPSAEKRENNITENEETELSEEVEGSEYGYATETDANTTKTCEQLEHGEKDEDTSRMWEHLGPDNSVFFKTIDSLNDSDLSLTEGEMDHRTKETEARNTEHEQTCLDNSVLYETIDTLSECETIPCKEIGDLRSDSKEKSTKQVSLPDESLQVLGSIETTPTDSDQNSKAVTNDVTLVTNQHSQSEIVKPVGIYAVIEDKVLHDIQCKIDEDTAKSPSEGEDICNETDEVVVFDNMSNIDTNGVELCSETEELVVLDNIEDTNNNTQELCIYETAEAETDNNNVKQNKMGNKSTLAVQSDSLPDSNSLEHTNSGTQFQSERQIVRNNQQNMVVLEVNSPLSVGGINHSLEDVKLQQNETNQPLEDMKVKQNLIQPNFICKKEIGVTTAVVVDGPTGLSVDIEVNVERENADHDTVSVKRESADVNTVPSYCQREDNELGEGTHHQLYSSTYVKMEESDSVVPLPLKHMMTGVTEQAQMPELTSEAVAVSQYFDDHNFIGGDDKELKCVLRDACPWNYQQKDQAVLDSCQRLIPTLVQDNNDGGNVDVETSNNQAPDLLDGSLLNTSEQLETTQDDSLEMPILESPDKVLQPASVMPILENANIYCKDPKRKSDVQRFNALGLSLDITALNYVDNVQQDDTMRCAVVEKRLKTSKEVEKCSITGTATSTISRSEDDGDNAITQGSAVVGSNTTEMNTSSTMETNHGCPAVNAVRNIEENNVIIKGDYSNVPANTVGSVSTDSFPTDPPLPIDTRSETLGRKNDSKLPFNAETEEEVFTTKSKDTGAGNHSVLTNTSADTSGTWEYPLIQTSEESMLSEADNSTSKKDQVLSSPRVPEDAETGNLSVLTNTSGETCSTWEYPLIQTSEESMISDADNSNNNLSPSVSNRDSVSNRTKDIDTRQVLYNDKHIKAICDTTSSTFGYPLPDNSKVDLANISTQSTGSLSHVRDIVPTLHDQPDPETISVQRRQSEHQKTVIASPQESANVTQQPDNSLENINVDDNILYSINDELDIASDSKDENNQSTSMHGLNCEDQVKAKESCESNSHENDNLISNSNLSLPHSRGTQCKETCISSAICSSTEATGFITSSCPSSIPPPSLDRADIAILTVSSSDTTCITTSSFPNPIPPTSYDSPVIATMDSPGVAGNAEVSSCSSSISPTSMNIIAIPSTSTSPSAIIGSSDSIPLPSAMSTPSTIASSECMDMEIVDLSTSNQAASQTTWASPAHFYSQPRSPYYPHQSVPYYTQQGSPYYIPPTTFPATWHPHAVRSNLMHHPYWNYPYLTPYSPPIYPNIAALYAQRVAFQTNFSGSSFYPQTQASPVYQGRPLSYIGNIMARNNLQGSSNSSTTSSSRSTSTTENVTPSTPQWITSTNNATPYLRNQNPDTYYLTSIQVSDDRVTDPQNMAAQFKYPGTQKSKKSSKKAKAATEFSDDGMLDIHQIPLPPPERRNTSAEMETISPQKLASLCHSKVDQLGLKDKQVGIESSGNDDAPKLSIGSENEVDNIERLVGERPDSCSYVASGGSSYITSDENLIQSGSVVKSVAIPNGNQVTRNETYHEKDNDATRKMENDILDVHRIPLPSQEVRNTSAEMETISPRMLASLCHSKVDQLGLKDKQRGFKSTGNDEEPTSSNGSENEVDNIERLVGDRPERSSYVTSDENLIESGSVKKSVAIPNENQVTRNETYHEKDNDATRKMENDILDIHQIESSSYVTSDENLIESRTVVKSGDNPNENQVTRNETDHEKDGNVTRKSGNILAVPQNTRNTESSQASALSEEKKYIKDEIEPEMNEVFATEVSENEATSSMDDPDRMAKRPPTDVEIQETSSLKDRSQTNLQSDSDVNDYLTTVRQGLVNVATVSETEDTEHQMPTVNDGQEPEKSECKEIEVEPNGHCERENAFHDAGGLDNGSSENVTTSFQDKPTSQKTDSLGLIYSAYSEDSDSDDDAPDHTISTIRQRYLDRLPTKSHAISILPCCHLNDGLHQTSERHGGFNELPAKSASVSTVTSSGLDDKLPQTSERHRGINCLPAKSNAIITATHSDLHNWKPWLSDTLSIRPHSYMHGELPKQSEAISTLPQPLSDSESQSDVKLSTAREDQKQCAATKDEDRSPTEGDSGAIKDAVISNTREIERQTDFSIDVPNVQATFMKLDAKLLYIGNKSANVNLSVDNQTDTDIVLTHSQINTIETKDINNSHSIESDAKQRDVNISNLISNRSKDRFRKRTRDVENEDLELTFFSKLETVDLSTMEPSQQIREDVSNVSNKQGQGVELSSCPENSCLAHIATLYEDSDSHDSTFMDTKILKDFAPQSKPSVVRTTVCTGEPSAVFSIVPETFEQLNDSKWTEEAGNNGQIVTSGKGSETEDKYLIVDEAEPGEIISESEGIENIPSSKDIATAQLAFDKLHTGTCVTQKASKQHAGNKVMKKCINFKQKLEKKFVAYPRRFLNKGKFSFDKKEKSKKPKSNKLLKKAISQDCVLKQVARRTECGSQEQTIESEDGEGISQQEKSAQHRARVDVENVNDKHQYTDRWVKETLNQMNKPETLQMKPKKKPSISLSLNQQQQPNTITFESIHSEELDDLKPTDTKSRNVLYGYSSSNSSPTRSRVNSASSDTRSSSVESIAKQSSANSKSRHSHSTYSKHSSTSSQSGPTASKKCTVINARSSLLRPNYMYGRTKSKSSNNSSSSRGGSSASQSRVGSNSALPRAGSKSSRSRVGSNSALPRAGSKSSQSRVGSNSALPRAGSKSSQSRVGSNSALPRAGSKSSRSRVGSNSALPRAGSKSSQSRVGSNSALPRAGSKSSQSRVGSNSALPRAGSKSSRSRVGSNSALPRAGSKSSQSRVGSNSGLPRAGSNSSWSRNNKERSMSRINRSRSKNKSSRSRSLNRSSSRNNSSRSRSRGKSSNSRSRNRSSSRNNSSRSRSRNKSSSSRSRNRSRSRSKSSSSRSRYNSSRSRSRNRLKSRSNSSRSMSGNNSCRSRSIHNSSRSRSRNRSKSRNRSRSINNSFTLRKRYNSSQSSQNSSQTRYRDYRCNTTTSRSMYNSSRSRSSHNSSRSRIRKSHKSSRSRSRSSDGKRSSKGKDCKACSRAKGSIVSCDKCSKTRPRQTQGKSGSGVHQAGTSDDRLSLQSASSQKAVFIETHVLDNMLPGRLSELLNQLDQMSTSRCLWKLYIPPQQMAHIYESNVNKITALTGNQHTSRVVMIDGNASVRHDLDPQSTLHQHAAQVASQPHVLATYVVSSKAAMKKGQSFQGVCLCTLKCFLEDHLTSV